MHGLGWLTKKGCCQLSLLLTGVIVYKTFFPPCFFCLVYSKLSNETQGNIVAVCDVGYGNGNGNADDYDDR